MRCWFEMTGSNIAYTKTAGPSGSGKKGPIQVIRNRLRPELLDLWQSSLENVTTLTVNNNSDQGSPIGISLAGPNSIEPTHYNASYSTSGNLPQAGPNLSILPDTMVAKVNLQGGAASNGSLYHTPRG